MGSGQAGGGDWSRGETPLVDSACWIQNSLRRIHTTGAFEHANLPKGSQICELFPQNSAYLVNDAGTAATGFNANADYCSAVHQFVPTELFTIKIAVTRLRLSTNLSAPPCDGKIGFVQLADCGKVDR